MKNLNVETLRGIAIILVVAGHVIGSTIEGGLQVANDSIWRYFYYSFEYLRLPLFTAISGYVYSLKPVNINYLKTFTLKKIRRLLFPLIFVGGLYYVVRNIIPGTNFTDPINEIWKIFILPYTLYWYLPSLFIIFVTVAMLDSFKLMNNKNKWFIIMICSIGLVYVEQTSIVQLSTNYFSFKGAMFLMPYFILGIGLNKFKEIFSKSDIKLSLIYLIIGIILQQILWFTDITASPKIIITLSLIIGIPFIVIAFNLNMNNKFLIKIAKYAYTIYLFHAFGTAGGRIILNAFNITNGILVFVISLSGAIILSIIAEILLDRIPITRLLFLGRNYKKK